MSGGVGAEPTREDWDRLGLAHIEHVERLRAQREAASPIGKVWRRREADANDDPYNVVVVCGLNVDVVDSVVDEGVVRDFVGVLVVTPFGAFGSPRTITADDLERDHVLLTDEEREQIAADQAAKSAAADAKNAKAKERVSPWRR